MTSVKKAIRNIPPDLEGYSDAYAWRRPKIVVELYKALGEEPRIVGSTGLLPSLVGQVTGKRHPACVVAEEEQAL